MKKIHLKQFGAACMAGAMLFAAGCGNTGNVSSDPQSGGGSSESSNFNESGWPVVNEKVTLKVYGPRNSNSYEDWNEYKLIQQMEAETNVHLEWELVEDSTYNDRKTLVLGSGTYPDIISSGITVQELVRYSSDGVFIPVDEMQEKYCPQLMKAYELVPELKATNTMPDGHAYSFPSYGDPQFSGLSRLLAINTDWLEAVDMEMPTTLEEFKEVLIAFRNKDPNGNGQKDEIPLSWMGPIYNSTTGWTFGLEWLADAFQCPSSQDLINVVDGKVTFVPATEEYKEFIKWLNELYKEGLLDEQGFSQDADQYKAKLNSDPAVVGVASTWEIGDDFATYDAYDHYDYLYPLKGLNGEAPVSYYGPSYGGSGMWVITKDCSMPEVAVRVADYFYDEMFSLQIVEGLFGEADEVGEDTQVRQVPCDECDMEGAYKVADPPEGVNTQTFRYKCCPTGNVPYFIQNKTYKAYQHLHYTDKKAALIDYVKANTADPEPIGILNYTTDELQVVTEAASQIQDYANRRGAEWVMNGKSTKNGTATSKTWKT